MLFVLQLTLLHNLQCEASIFITPPKNLTYRFTYCHFVKKIPHIFITLHVLLKFCGLQFGTCRVFFILNEWKEQQVQTIYT